MDRNFVIRVLCGIGLLIIAAASSFIASGILFKILFGVFSAIAGIELISFFKKKHQFKHFILAAIEITFLIAGSICIAQINIIEIWLIIFGVCGYDSFAYLGGQAFGGKIFKNSRPFPRISKNKTWEGTLSGIILSVGLVALVLAVLEIPDYFYLLCGPLAMIGDLFESCLKRQFKVKDSNEILIKNQFFEKLELIVGGTKGHGGFLDRIDSLAFTASVILVIMGLCCIIP